MPHTLRWGEGVSELYKAMTMTLHEAPAVSLLPALSLRDGQGERNLVMVVTWGEGELSFGYPRTEIRKFR